MGNILIFWEKKNIDSGIRQTLIFGKGKIKFGSEALLNFWERRN